MGARYYDPLSGRFLSPDPISYPLCLDLYAYADGDPVNYQDLDGRFASPVYQKIRPAATSAFQFFKDLKQVSGLNPLATYLADHNFTRSKIFEVGSFDLPSGGILYINGIDNQFSDAVKSIEQISQFAGGAKVYGIYNATNFKNQRAASILTDIVECGLGKMGMHTPPVQLLKTKWNQLIATNGPEAKFLQISSSGGAIHVYNALLTSPKEVQQRIISLAFAPAVIIPEGLCFKAYNYASRRDFVTHLDIMGKLKYGKQLQILEPHPNAKFWDHGFLSPTFDDPKEGHIGDYIKKYGG